MKYKIEKKTTYNLNQIGGNYQLDDNEQYYIKYQKLFLGIIPYWVYVMELNYMYRECHYSPIGFRSVEKAEEFAKKYTCNGITEDTVKYETVKEFEC
jgi:hypothetical protein